MVAAQTPINVGLVVDAVPASCENLWHNGRTVPASAPILPMRADDEIREEGRMAGAREAIEYVRIEVTGQLQAADQQYRMLMEAKVRSEHEAQLARAHLEFESRKRINLEQERTNREL